MIGDEVINRVASWPSLWLVVSVECGGECVNVER